jgi:hypothetical protein
MGRVQIFRRATAPRPVEKSGASASTATVEIIKSAKVPLTVACARTDFHIGNVRSGSLADVVTSFAMSAVPPKTDIDQLIWNVRLVPITDKPNKEFSNTTLIAQ